jgi:hypothetical protein
MIGKKDASMIVLIIPLIISPLQVWEGGAKFPLEEAKETL